MISNFIYPLVFVGLVFSLAAYLLRVWHKNETMDVRATSESSRDRLGSGN